MTHDICSNRNPKLGWWLGWWLGVVSSDIPPCYLICIPVSRISLGWNRLIGLLLKFSDNTIWLVWKLETTKNGNYILRDQRRRNNTPPLTPAKIKTQPPTPIITDNTKIHLLVNSGLGGRKFKTRCEEILNKLFNTFKKWNHPFHVLIYWARWNAKSATALLVLVLFGPGFTGQHHFVEEMTDSYQRIHVRITRFRYGLRWSWSVFEDNSREFLPGMIPFFTSAKFNTKSKSSKWWIRYHLANFGFG